MSPAPSGCPCGSGLLLDQCCGPVLDGHPAATAEALMRSRYTAFALAGSHLRAADHLWRSWHPATRPDDCSPDAATIWEGLRILEVIAGGPDDLDGVVTFEASWRQDGQRGVLRERSRFTRRAGRWVYLDGDVG